MKGRIEIANAELDDLVIARADGTPTYNFCVVVDDLDMRITHVIRGDDHVNNTPRQINILRALGATPPVYAHLPTVLAPGRREAVQAPRRGRVLQYAREATCPRRWSTTWRAWAGRTATPRCSGARSSSLVRPARAVSPSPARFDPEKLQWLNHEHLKRLPADELGAAPGAVSRPRRARSGVRAGRRRGRGAAARPVGHTRRDGGGGALFLRGAAPRSRNAAEQSPPPTAPALAELPREFATIDWTREAIGAAIKAAAARHGLKPALVMMPLRTLVAGTPQTPAIDAVLALLGRDDGARRIAAGRSRHVVARGLAGARADLPASAAFR